jgi:hypothetical protein
VESDLYLTVLLLPTQNPGFPEALSPQILYRALPLLEVGVPWELHSLLCLLHTAPPNSPRILVPVRMSPQWAGRSVRPSKINTSVGKLEVV